MDFMTIAMAVTAADTFVNRHKAADGWTRQISVSVPLCDPGPWHSVKSKLETALRFLSGDLWSVEIRGGGFEPPRPYSSRFRLLDLRGLDCVCLFSGGLDSAIGAIDLLSGGRRPLLVSHAYQGDQSHQNAVASHIKGHYERFSLNAYPQSAGYQTDITMRTRSLNFLSFAAVGCDVVGQINELDQVDLIVPENGFISLNAPLTPRRIGSLSTRTTHPHFISAIQEIFIAVGIGAQISNPYQFKTKGEMIKSCTDKIALKSIIPETVSCSNWRRKRQQCGRCIPCLIRRAAMAVCGITEPPYRYPDLNAVLRDENGRDDLYAAMAAISQLKNKPIGAWIADAAPSLSIQGMHTRESFKGIARSRGLPTRRKIVLIVDMHCHLDLYSKPSEVAQQCSEEGYVCSLCHNNS